ncbi:SHOCT domain-containing protein [Haladaptatus cibarius]|uniref:SHOCT domain-containing protein n=1 Tax=Haladaptatus cibarius TaxID=453847 RepID=UPI000679CD97|nr:SHOCT domain-containing protein [Haladaptatus cibarius]
MSNTHESLADQISGIFALLVLGAGLTALFLGYSWFWMVFVLGFAVALPIVAILSESLFGTGDESKSEWREDESKSEQVDEQQDALDTLRRRYACGEIDEAEFERRVALLLENKTVSDVRARREREQKRETERERERN